MLEHLGLSVNRLIRISYGPFQLGELKPGDVEEVRGRVLRDQLGEKLANAAGADFEAPIRAPKAGRTEATPKARQAACASSAAGLEGAAARRRSHTDRAPSARRATGCASRSSTSWRTPTAAEPETRVLDLFAGTGALGAGSDLARRGARALRRDERRRARAHPQEHRDARADRRHPHPAPRRDGARQSGHDPAVRPRLPRPALRQRARREGA